MMIDIVLTFLRNQVYTWKKEKKFSYRTDSNTLDSGWVINVMAKEYKSGLMVHATTASF